ncbi:acetate--CoA ligase family protein [Peristeroidobacter soli]|uniref:acetate--CoA ligase family protein n=1 Tax=Peristeroidobacter soli TaxID=2497877 RepID=UPI00101CB1E1|nr:acetate--CoA ligase family protein [Peristeroidobacter soli]
MSISRLLRPRSVAIVGASSTRGSLGAGVLANLDRFSFAKPLHLVNPRYDRIGDRRCVRSIAELPDGIDCAVLAIPQAHIADAVRACAEKNIGGLIVLAGGFAEAGEEGKRAQQEIAAIAQSAGIALQGPNCLGSINYVDSVPLMFGVAPFEALGDRPGVAVVSQSGAMASAVRVALQARGVGVSYSVSTGNEASLGAEDFLEEFIGDPHTRVIAMLMEQIRRPARFLDLATRAREAGKYVVLHHLGRSAAGRDAAKTHTGALSGDYSVMAAQVTARGVCLVDSLEALIDVPELLIRLRNPRAAGGTAIVGESGAFKGLALDFCETVGLQLPPLSASTHAALVSQLPVFSPPSNPLDLTAQAMSDTGLYRRVLELIAVDAAFGSVVLTLSLPSAESADRKLPLIIEALRSLDGKPDVVFAMLGEDCPIPQTYVEQIRSTGTPFFRSPERAFRALAAVKRLARSFDVTPAVARALEAPLDAGMIPEYRAKQLLARRGLTMPASRFVVSFEEALKAADELGFPLALKAQSSQLPHKSEAGAVALDIRDDASLRSAWTAMKQRLSLERPGVSIDGMLLERMSEAGIEIIIGARNEAGWGPVIMVGLGGILTELLQDVVFIPAGVGRAQIEQALRSLKGAKLFDGYRGAPPADLDAAITVVEILSTLLLQHPEIVEADLNPVRIHPRGQGATVLDALFVVGNS